MLSIRVQLQLLEAGRDLRSPPPARSWGRAGRGCHRSRSKPKRGLHVFRIVDEKLGALFGDAVRAQESAMDVPVELFLLRRGACQREDGLNGRWQIPLPSRSVQDDLVVAPAAFVRRRRLHCLLLIDHQLQEDGRLSLFIG